MGHVTDGGGVIGHPLTINMVYSSTGPMSTHGGQSRDRGGGELCTMERRTPHPLYVQHARIGEVGKNLTSNNTWGRG